MALAAIPRPAAAHTRLVSSLPAEGARLSAPPRELRLVFSEPPEPALTMLRLLRAGGDTVRVGAPGREAGAPNTIVAAVQSAIPPGSYRLEWSVASRDGHVVRGTVDFSVLSQDTLQPQPTAIQFDSPPSRQEVRFVAVGAAAGFVGARWLSFISLFVVIGVLGFRFLVLRRNAGDADSFSQVASTNAATLGLIGAFGIMLAALLKLVRESGDMPDIPLTSILLNSTWGWALLVQITASVAAVTAFRGAHKPDASEQRSAWRLALMAGIALAVTPALSGHAIASSRALLLVPLDVIHVVAGSLWLGTLAAIVVVGIPAGFKSPDMTRPGARTAQMINVFSPTALVCGAAIVASGIAASALQLPRPSALWTTPYGATLMVKILFVVLVFGAGAWNWRRLRPRLTGDDAVHPLRSMALLELTLGMIVLGVTAVLVALELPG